jgi:uncharacterized protein YjiS (DUF1127 family)
MSCGSTIDNSINTLDGTSASFPAFRWSWKIPFAWLVAIAMWWDRRDQYRQLLELDDRLLADIGVSRTDVEEVRRSPLYLDAWRDSR